MWRAPVKQQLMDIELLSKMVKELILDNDKVALPGLGSFVAEIVPATFSDKGYTINPPYRRLYFRSRPDDGDALVDFYARSNDIDRNVAEKILKDFLVELKEVLHIRKTVVFPGLGRLRATKENTIFFVADENLDIYPAGFGLEPVSLKTHQETKEEVSAAVIGLKSLLDTSLQEPSPLPDAACDPEPVAQTPDTETPDPEIPDTEIQVPETAEARAETSGPSREFVSESESPAPLSGSETTPPPVPAPVLQNPTFQDSISRTSIPEAPDSVCQAQAPLSGSETPSPGSASVSSDSVTASPDPAPRRRSAGKLILRIILAVTITAILLLAVYALVGRLYPEFVDTFLYSPEELKILNH